MKQLIDDQLWSDRLKTADMYYKEWEQLFKCDALDKYYEGIQWKSQLELSYDPYVINKVYETIQIKIAEFVPTFPQYTVSASPQAEQDLDAAMQSANLKADVLNTVCDEQQSDFSEEMEQAYKDSFFRFGIVEVGYSAEWIMNPNVRKPLLAKDVDAKLPSQKRSKIIEEPPEIPTQERVYIKHIPAKKFRIGGMDHKYLARCGWVGYYEFVHKDDLLSIKKLLNRDKLQSNQGTLPDPDREMVRQDSARYKQNSVKIWKLWDLRAGLQLLVVDNPTLTVWQKPFKRLPLFDYRPDRRLITDGFYPIPPAYHWLSPQNEFNETREALRTHRRRFMRKFQVIEGAVDDEEIEKFETGPDGALIKVKRENAITPIENADLGQALAESVQTSADDLNRISGTSDESRGVADRTTATQANIVNQRTALRETKERDRVVKWYVKIGREVLLVVRDRFTGSVLVKLNQPEGEMFLGEMQTQGQQFKFILAEDLRDGYDFKITVDLTSMSSTAQAQEKQRFIEFLTILTQFPQIAFSPILVREAAYRVGYRNEKVIAEFQKMALLMELSRMNQLQAAAGQPAPAAPGAPLPVNQPQQVNQQAVPPQMDQIRSQLAKVLPMATQQVQ